MVIQSIVSNFQVDQPVEVGKSFSEKFLNIFPNVPLMIATIISFILAFMFLTYFLYKPLKRKMKERHDYIQNNIDASLKEKQLAIQKTNEANSKLIDAHKQADVIINKAKLRAEKVIISYAADAKRKSNNLLQEANRDIAAQKIEFAQKSKEKIAEAAVELAKKILTNEVSIQSQKSLINEFLNDQIDDKKGK